MSCLGKRVGIPGERRNSERRPLNTTGSAVAIQGSRSILIEDYGRDGAKVSGHDLPTIGAQVLIWMDGLIVLGSVIWARFRERGVLFDQALEPAALTYLEEQARTESALAPGQVVQS